MNNESLGMITQFQHLYFNDNMAGTTARGGYLVPNIQAIAQSVNLPYYEMDEKSIEKNILSNEGYALIDYHIDGLTTVCPKLEYNKSISQPTPQLPESEFIDAMIYE